MCFKVTCKHRFPGKSQVEKELVYDWAFLTSHTSAENLGERGNSFDSVKLFFTLYFSEHGVVGTGVYHQCRLLWLADGSEFPVF